MTASDDTPSSNTGRYQPRLFDVVLASMAGFTLTGLLLGGLTLELNPHLQNETTDSILLLLYFAFGYGVMGLALGLAGGACVWLLSRSSLPSSLIELSTTTLATVLLLAPLAYYLLLPDVGFSGGLLTTAIFDSSRTGKLIFLASLGLALVTISLGVQFFLRHLAWRMVVKTRTLMAVLVVLAAGTFFITAVRGRTVEATEAIDGLQTGEISPLFEPDPLLLLCIDGADFGIIRPMIEDGELPHFARLLQEGTSGPLATDIPTRSPNLWTSIATGKLPGDHGIRHFVTFRFPGLKQRVDHFPSHTGLNFHVIPKIEAIPGMPAIQTPYTSNMRRVETLWTIASRYYPVGVYRWLVTWPAESLNGFVVAASVVAGVFETENGRLIEGGKPLGEGVFHPPELQQQLRFDRDRWQLRDAEVEAYVGSDQEFADDHPRIAAIRESLTDPTIEILADLRQRFAPTFAVAGFYPVDSFQHYFSRARQAGRAFAPAIAERYRYTDARLGELLATLDEKTNLVIISDHGFDFEKHHHSLAPPGIFIGHGPAFPAGHQVESLSIYDIAPLTLHLLGLPLADDMAGSHTETYRKALSQAFLERGAVGRIATYEWPDEALQEPVPSSIDQEIKEDLKSLGYIN